MEKVWKKNVVTNYDITPDTLTPIASGELQLCKQWVEKMKLEEEIRTGFKLQHAKPKLPYLRELRVVDIKSKKRPPPIPSKVKNRSRNAKTLPGTKNLPSAPNKSSSCITKCKTDKCQSQKYTDCPTRIIQLATPSKRHCLENWRNRSNTLPPIMLERLKKYVNDEAPVIPIGEAITCFQMKKGKPMKKPKVKSVKSTFISQRDKLEFRDISSIFGSKIVKRLITPMKVQLKDNWQRVADNVQYDTAKLMRKCCRETKFGAKMNEEVANKVTVWIATILDESELKLLDDQLEEINEVQGPVIDFIEELIDQAIAILNEKFKASEKLSDVSMYESDDEASSYTDSEKTSEDSVVEDAKEIKDVIKLGKSSKTFDDDINETNNIQVEEIDDNITPVIKEVITEIIDSIENKFVDAIDVFEAVPEAMNADIGAIDKPIEELEPQETSTELYKDNTEIEDMNAKDDGQEKVSDTADLNVIRDVSRSESQTFQLAENTNINNSDDNANTEVSPEVKIDDITTEIEADLSPTDLQNIEKDMNQLKTQEFNVNIQISTENNITDIPTAEAAYEINESSSKDQNIITEDIESKQLQQDVNLSWKNSETNLLDENTINKSERKLPTGAETNQSRINIKEEQEKVDDLTTDSIIKLLTDTSQPSDNVDKSATNSMRNLESSSPPQEMLEKWPSGSLTNLLNEQPVENVDKSTTDSVTQLLMNNSGQIVEKVDKSTTGSVTQLQMNNVGQPFEKVDKSTIDSVTQLLMDKTGQPIEMVDKSTADSVTQLQMNNAGQPFEKVDKSTTDSVTQVLMDNAGQPIEMVDKSTTDSVTQLLMDNAGQPIEIVDKSTTDSVTQVLDNAGQPIEMVDKSTTDSVTQLLMENAGQPIEIVDKSTTDSVTQVLMDNAGQPIEIVDKSTTDSVTQLLMDNAGQPIDIVDKSTTDSVKQLLMDNAGQSIEKEDKSATDSVTNVVAENDNEKRMDDSEIKIFPEIEKKVSNEDSENMSIDSELRLLVKNLSSQPQQSIGSSIMSVTDFLGKHIHFSTPKPELLTKVDENWPEDVSRTKVTASVTKSITSLGNIREYFIDEDEIKTSEMSSSDKAKKIEKVEEKINDIAKPSIDQKMEVRDDVSAKGDSNIELVPPKQIKFQYKVNPETAPVWLRNIISEPNEKELKISKSAPTKEQCTSLYEAYSRMENWSEWLQKTCENIERLKNNEVSFGENRIKDWAQLKNHIDYDIARWKIFCAKTKTATRRIQSKQSCKCSAK